MSLKDRASSKIDEIREELIEVSNFIHSNPELGHQEYKASELLVKNLRKQGFNVREKVAGMETAFVAEMKGKHGPVIGILAEYDCLPGIGHACGHNLIASTALGAAIGLSSVIAKLEGSIVVYGTPAEEGVVQNAGGKVVMIDEIRRADAALMIHPGSVWGSYGTTNARESFLVEFHGRSSHAGAAPEKGINALEGVLLTFQGINALRQHICGDIRIHGIIKQGGDSPNTVPDYASAHLYVRAPTMPMLLKTYEKVKNIAKGAALSTRARVEISQVANTYANKIPNKILSDLFRENMVALGVDFPVEEEAKKSGASTDFGNVSQEMPALSGYINIGDVVLHSPSGAKATATPEAHEAMLLGAKGIAFTSIDLLTRPDLLVAAKKEHKKRFEEQSL